MQNYMELKSANDNNPNLSVANFNKSEFVALSKENQMLFLASALVGIGNEISELIKGQDQLIMGYSELRVGYSKLSTGLSKLRADQKSLQDEISLLDAKLDGFNDNLENQYSKIKDQNQRKSNTKSRIKFWVIG